MFPCIYKPLNNIQVSLNLSVTLNTWSVLIHYIFLAYFEYLS